MFTFNTCITKRSNDPQSNLIPMLSATKNPIEILTASAATIKIQGADHEREPAIASLLPKDVSCIKELVCQNGGKIRLEWNPRTGINVCLFSSEESSISIRPENLPREFHQIKCSRGFYQFMKGLSVRLIELDNGEWKISAFHPLRGGMMEDHSHLEGAREAFEMIAPHYKKTLPSSDHNIQKFTKWLKNSDIFCGKPVETDRQGLIHAILQHATGRYGSGELFSETTPLSQEISTIPTSSSESPYNTTLQHTLNSIKSRHHLEMRVILIQANQKGQPVKISQVGNETAHPVVIWKRGDEYLALTTTDYHKPVEEGLPSPNEEEAFSPDPDLPPNASTTVDLPSTGEKINSIGEAINALRIHLRHLKNPFVRQSIQNTLQAMGVFRPSEGIASFFEEIILPQDSQQCIHALSKAITEQARELRQNFDLLGELKRLKALGEEQMPEEQSWKELDMLLELDEIKKLPNKTIKIVMSFITNKDQAHLLSYLRDELERIGVNLAELDRKLGELKERMCLDSLIRLIIRRKVVASASLIWHQSPPGSFIGKVLSLTNPITKENHTGVISNCVRSNKIWIFTLIDESKVEIHQSSNRVSLSKFRNIELCHALVEGVIDQINQTESNKIELISSDTRRTQINPGKYTISAHWHQIPLKRSEQALQLEVKLSGSKNQGDYVIHMMFSKNNRDLKNLVEVRIVDLNQPLSGKILNVSQFRDSYFIRELHTVTLPEIDIQENVKYLQFQEEDPNTMKIYYLEVVKKKEIRLRTKLLNDHHIKTLEYLLDNLVSNRLKSISPIEELEIPDDFKQLLNETARIYHEKLDRPDISAENILMQIVIDTNYARLVDRTQSILVGKAIQLIHAAYAQISKIRDNDVILFMGNTGAGKSTGINFFLNAPLEEFQNKVGDKAVKIRDGITNPEKYPKIGQSLGTSETLYGQGYEVRLPGASTRLRTSGTFPELRKFLVDCPGFNDTRGSDYELCAALSLDQIVNACHSITCIVLVVPMQAFLVDKANPVIEFVESVRKIFLGAFRPDTSEKALPIHMLITKHSPDEEINFKHRISGLLFEAQNQLKKSINDQEATETEITTHQRRAEIWELIAEMIKVDEERTAAESPEDICVRNTLSFLNITDTLQSGELLMWYNRSKSLLQSNRIKHSYVPRMQNPDLKEKLGYYVQSFVHTWCEGVVRQYFEIIPKMILRLEQLITKSTLNLASLREDQKRNQISLAKCEEDIAVSQELNAELHAVDIKTIKPDLYKSLEQKVINSNQSSLSILKEEIRNTQIYIENRQDPLTEAQENLASTTQEIEDYTSIITEKRNQIQRLSEGERETLLGEFTCQPQGSLIVNTISYLGICFNSIYKTIDAANRHPGRQEQVSSSKRVQANEFRGTLKHWVEVPNDYRLVLAENINISKSFWEGMKFWNWYNRSFGSGTRTARVIGNGVTLNLAETVENGNQTIYCFETTWTASNNLPSFRIFHSQPNQIYNAGSIANREAEINDLNEFLRQAQADAQRHQSTIDRINEDIGQANQRLDALQQEKTFLKCRLSDGLIQWRSEVTRKLENLNQRQANYRTKITEAEDNLRKADDDLRDLMIELYELIRKKRNLAIIVQTQIEVASMVREFINAILLRTEFAEIRALDGMISDCSRFMKSFDTDWERLRDECYEDLLSTHHKLSLPPSSSSYAASSSSSSSSSYAASSSSSPTASSSSGKWDH